MKPKYIQISLIAILLTQFFINLIYGSTFLGIAYDEFFHIPDGAALFQTGERRLKIAHPPLGSLLAGVSISIISPVINTSYYLSENVDRNLFGQMFFWNNIYPVETLLFYSRLPFMLLGVACAFYVYLLSRSMWGAKPALCSLILCSFCPSMIAWSRHVYFDVPTAFGLVALTSHLWWYLNSSKFKHLFLSGLFLGILLSFKFSGLTLIPFILFALILKQFININGETTISSLKGYASKIAKELLVVFIVCILIVWLSFGCPLSIYFYTDKLNDLYWDMNKSYRYYFMGEFKAHSWWSYFPINLLLKSSCATIFLSMFSLILGVRTFLNKSNVSRNQDFLKIIFLVTPIALFLIATCLKALPLGSRYIIPLFPMIYVICGYALSYAYKECARKEISILTTTLLIFHIWGSVRIFPDQMAYFNEFIGSPDNGILWVNDSSIDAGQNLPRLAKFIREKKNNQPIKILYQGVDKPEYYGLKTQVVSKTDWDISPSPGLYAISANRLVYGQLEAKEGPGNHKDWLRTYTPIKRIGGSIWVYEFK